MTSALTGRCATAGRGTRASEPEAERGMLRHYVSAMVRGWRRAPWATVVNVVTLALGLGCFVVAYAVTDYLGSADRQFANADRTLVVTTRIRAREGPFDSGVQPRSNRELAR